MLTEIYPFKAAKYAIFSVYIKFNFHKKFKEQIDANLIFYRLIPFRNDHEQYF